MVFPLRLRVYTKNRELEYTHQTGRQEHKQKQRPVHKMFYYRIVNTITHNDNGEGLL